MNLSDYTISGVALSGQFSCSNDILVNSAYILQTIMTLSSSINSFNYNPVINGTLSTSGIVCYDNSSVSGGIYTTKDININNDNILQTILSLSDRIKLNVASSILSAYNLTFSGGLNSNSIICYNNLSISGVLYRTKYININNYKILQSIFILSGLIKTGLLLQLVII